MISDNETIYDEQISPLMSEIIEICKRHNIPLAFQCQYSEEGLVTTTLPVEGQSVDIEAVMRLMRPKSSSSFNIRIEHSDGSQTFETIVP